MKPRCPECNLLHIHRPSCSRSPFAPVPGRADAGIDLDIAEAIKPGSTLAHNIGRADADITPTPFKLSPEFRPLTPDEQAAVAERPPIYGAEEEREHKEEVVALRGFHPVSKLEQGYADYVRYCKDHPLGGHGGDRLPCGRAEFDYDQWLTSRARQEQLDEDDLYSVRHLADTRDGWVNAAENPKESAGREKVSFGGTFPAGALVPVARVFQVGAEKYGRLNWRTAGIQVTTYESAVMRHLLALMDGQDVDPESGQSHWAHIAAGAMIVLDATGLGKVANDRPAPGSAAELLAALAPGRRSPR